MELCKGAATIRFRSGVNRPFSAEDFEGAFKIVKFAGRSGEEANEAREKVSHHSFSSFVFVVCCFIYCLLMVYSQLRIGCLVLFPLKR